ncbi:VWA domain-containing protein [Candidatus Uabimicrobium sp. HlEnr_7]|uniref:VWA domain-containing protein n=1 Tax=Candidatus Uabimicrobium helgolandensis TaxID=3095367 RepID=UPI003556C0B8
MKRREKLQNGIISLLIHTAIIYLWAFCSQTKKHQERQVTYQVTIENITTPREIQKVGGTNASESKQKKVRQTVTHNENWFPIDSSQQEFLAPVVKNKVIKKQSPFVVTGERLLPVQGNVARILQKVRSQKAGNGVGAGNGDGVGDGTVFFNINKQHKNIIYLIDISQSMNINRVKQQLYKSYRKLTKQYTFNIIAFCGETKAWQKELQPATAQNKKNADIWVENLSQGYSTNLYKALGVTYKMIKQSATIFLVSDGYTIDPYLLLRDIKKWRKGLDVHLNIIAVGKRLNSILLEKLAFSNNGSYIEK